MGRITVEANMGAIGALMKYSSEKQKRLAADYVLGGDKPVICITDARCGKCRYRNDNHSSQARR